MRVAALQCAGYEARLSERSAVILTVIALGLDVDLLAVHRQQTRVNRDTVVGGQSRGDKRILKGILDRTHIGNGSIVAERQALASSHTHTADRHLLLRQGRAVVGLVCRAAGEGDGAAGDVQLAIHRLHIIAAAHIHAIVGDAVSCHIVGHRSGVHILDFTRDDHLQGVAVGELIDAIGRGSDRSRGRVRGAILHPSHGVAGLRVVRTVIRPVAVVGGDLDVNRHTFHLQLAVVQRHTVVVGSGGRIEGVARDGIGHLAIARELHAALDDRSDCLARHHTITRNGEGGVGVDIAVIRIGGRGGIDRNLSAGHGQGAGVYAHAVVGGNLTRSQRVGKGILLAALVSDAGEVAIGGFLTR